jgi:lysophospholipase II
MTKMENLQGLEVVSPISDHKYTIIFLHGRDSNAHEFKIDFLESETSDDRTLPAVFPDAKWIFPTSRIRHSERFNNKMSQWFDIWSIQTPNERSELQEEGIKDSLDFILELIRSEMILIRAERIILAGISQGCAVAILALLKSGIQLAGFIGLSSWLTVSNLNEYITDACSIQTPVFLSHSTGDMVVPIGSGENLRQGLEDIGMKVEWHMYIDDNHWINEPKGVDDIVLFLKTCFCIKG